MNKSQLKQYLIENAIAERNHMNANLKWSKELLQQGKKKEAKQFEHYEDMDRARFMIYKDIIELLDCEEEYYQALTKEITK